MKTLVAAVALLVASPVLAQSSNVNPVLEDCQLSFLKENNIEIPAEQAGVLRMLSVREGSTIEQEGQVIAQIDDKEAEMKERIAVAQLNSAHARYRDEIEKEYAIKAAEVALADYEGLREANSGGVKRAVTATDLRRAKLEWERALLQGKKADKDKELARFEYHIRRAEWDAAKMEVERRVIKAPFAGRVLEVYRNQGEWVNPGDPILQLVRYDKLMCDGTVFFDDYDPREIEGCEVLVEVSTGRISEQATGRVTYVEQKAEYGLQYSYRVRAEITNKEVAGRWALFPGLPAKMTIKLGTATQNIGKK